MNSETKDRAKKAIQIIKTKSDYDFLGDLSKIVSKWEMEIL